MKKIKFVSLFLAVIWGVFFVDTILPFLHLSSLGIHPRSLSGLIGIVFMPFLHGNLLHIISNSVPLFVLLLIAMSYNGATFLPVISAIVLLSGLSTWLFGMPGSNHIGASGLVFGLVGYLISVGYFKRSPIAIIVSVAVFFLYGGALLLMLIPLPGISWIGHISGFFAGVYMAKIKSQKSVSVKMT